MAAVLSVSDLDEIRGKLLVQELKELDENVDKKIEYVMKQAGINFIDALEYVVTSDPMLWAAVYLGWQARDYQKDILACGKKKKKVVLRLGRRLGKCLPGDVLIPDPVTGERVTVEELYKRQKANIFSLDESTLKIVSHKTDIIFTNGIKPVFKVTTKSGRELKATGNHPLYTIEGFKEIDDLNPGDYIAIAKNQIHSNPLVTPEEEIKMLAYIIGDGNCTSGYLRFSCEQNNTKVLQEMNSLCKYFKSKLTKYKSNKPCDYHITTDMDLIKVKRVDHSEVRRLLRKHNLYGKGSHDKFVPDDIFKLSNEQLAVFLSRLYATDGWATCSKEAKARIELGYCSVSKQLVVGIQSLLLRFGINAVISEKHVKYNDGINLAYMLGVYNARDVMTFCEKIGIYSKESAVDEIYKAASSMIDYGEAVPIAVSKFIKQTMADNKISKQQLRNATEYRFDHGYNTVTKSKIQRVIDFTEDKSLNKYCDNDVYWDKIVSIEYVGDEQTYDLTVPEYHNFVANDFVTHNTDSLVILILWFSCTQINKGPNNQYDILIIAPFETQINLIFKRLQQIIDTSPYLQSKIARSVEHLYEWYNGTTILGLTAGAKSGSGAANTRGQRAD